MWDNQDMAIAVLIVILVVSIIAGAIDTATKSDFCRLLMYTSQDYEFRLKREGRCQVLSPSGEWTNAKNVQLFEPAIDGE